MSNKSTLKELGLNYKKSRLDIDFNLLFHRIQPNLLSYIKNIVGDMNSAEDIFSSTMTIIYNRIDTYNPKWNISTWIYKIAKNEALMYIKRNNKNVDCFSQIEGNTNTLDRINKSHMFVENDFVINEELNDIEDEKRKKLKDIEDAIYNSGDLYREILIRRFLLDHKYEQISDDLSLPLQTVKNRVRRGRLKIQRELGVLEETY